MEKDEQRLREVIRDWLESDSDVKYRDRDELVEEYVDTVVSNEDLENFGYTEQDKDEIYDVVGETVDEYLDEINDIYTVAEEWDGNMANDTLDADEWEEIYNNAPDVFINALYAREKYVVSAFNWAEIPSQVWEWLEQSVEEKIGFTSYEPESIIDNVIVNGSYGDFDDFKDEDETDEEFIARAEDDCLQIYPEDRFIIYSL